MKIVSLSLLLMCLSAMPQAQQPSQAQTGKQSFLEGPPPTAGFSVLNFTGDRTPPRDASNFFCAYMRTYRVKRQHRDSDVVTAAGYTTCVPSKRFELRSAVEVQRDPAPRE